MKWCMNEMYSIVGKNDVSQKLNYGTYHTLCNHNHRYRNEK